MLISGAVTYIQRFGSALNLNVHLHNQISDGVYEQSPGGILKFHRIAAPTLDEIKSITKKIAKRVHRYLEKRINELEHDAIATKEPMLAKCYEASSRYLRIMAPTLVNHCCVSSYNQIPTMMTAMSVLSQDLIYMLR